MSKRKRPAPGQTELEFWNNTTPETAAYCRTGREMLVHPVYVNLPESAKGVYLLMRCSCGSNRNDYFKLTYSEAQKAGYEAETFRRSIKKLQEWGFIECKLEQRRGDPTEYRFTKKWVDSELERKAKEEIEAKKAKRKSR